MLTLYYRGEPFNAEPFAEGGQATILKHAHWDRVLVCVWKPGGAPNECALRTHILSRRNKNKAAPKELVLPIGPVTDAKGKLVGHLMRMVDGCVSLNAVLTAEGRKVLRLNWDLVDLIHLCVLLFILLNKCHRAGFILADNGPDNFLVKIDRVTRKPTAVYRIDTVGSLLFDHQPKGKAHPVAFYSPWTPEFLPPELQDQDYRVPEYRQTRSSDVFAFAMFAFMLLTDHNPTGYAGGPPVYCVEDKIKGRLFAFWGRLPSKATVPDALQAAYKRVPKRLDSLLEHTFVGPAHSRPSAVPFIRELKKYRAAVERSARWAWWKGKFLPAVEYVRSKWAVWVAAALALAAVVVLPSRAPKAAPPPRPHSSHQQPASPHQAERDYWARDPPAPKPPPENPRSYQSLTTGFQRSDEP